MKNAFASIRQAARALANNRRTLLLIFVVYIALLGTLTLFILTREATFKDVIVTMVTLIVIPLLFFLLQAMSITYAKTEGARDFVKESCGLLRKLAVVTIPFIIIGIILFLILGKIDARFSAPLQGHAMLSTVRDGETWQQLLVSTIRLILFGIVFPLVSIHTWIEVRRHDVRHVFSRIKPIMSRAFSLPSLKTYVLGFAFFGIIPYVLTMVRTPSSHAWLEISMLAVRVLIALSMTLLGWVITVGALQRISSEAE